MPEMEAQEMFDLLMACQDTFYYFPRTSASIFPGSHQKIISLKAHTNSVVEGISAIEIRATCSILLAEFPPLSRELPNMYTRQASVQPNFTNLNMEWTHR